MSFLTLNILSLVVIDDNLIRVVDATFGGAAGQMSKPGRFSLSLGPFQHLILLIIERFLHFSLLIKSPPHIISVFIDLILQRHEIRAII